VVENLFFERKEVLTHHHLQFNDIGKLESLQRQKLHELFSFEMELLFHKNEQKTICLELEY